MDLNKLLEEMRGERSRLAEVIASFERLATGTTRRGRPPKWVKAVNTAKDAPTKTKRAVAP